MRSKEKILLFFTILLVLSGLAFSQTAQTQGTKPIVVILDPGHGYGNDSGTKQKDKNGIEYKESDLNKKLVEQLEKNFGYLKNTGFVDVEVVHDKDGEIWPTDKTEIFELRDRATNIKKWLKENEDKYSDSIVISSHNNAAVNKAGDIIETRRGNQVFYGEGAEKFAKDVRASLWDSTKGFYDDKLKGTNGELKDTWTQKVVPYTDSGYTDRMGLLRKLSEVSIKNDKLPSKSILIEFATMTNKDDLELLKQAGVQAFADIATADVINGMVKYLKKLNATKIVLIMPSGDHPDDTYDNSSYIIAAFPMVKYKVKAPIGILENGYYFEATKLLDKLNHEYTLIDPSSFDPSIAQEMPLLFIPSGGLMGLEESAFFKGTLKSYIENGGNVIVLSQQRGYEFSALPTPPKADGTVTPISGYGWT
jgi:N-acetylmuramoyl-L-alanine amidase